MYFITHFPSLFLGLILFKNFVTEFRNWNFYSCILKYGKLQNRCYLYPVFDKVCYIGIVSQHKCILILKSYDLIDSTFDKKFGFTYFCYNIFCLFFSVWYLFCFKVWLFDFVNNCRVPARSYTMLVIRSIFSIYKHMFVYGD